MAIDADLMRYGWLLIVGLVGVIWTMLNNKIDSAKSGVDKAVSKETFNNHVQRSEIANRHIWEELTTHRSHIGKIFDQLGLAEQRAFTRHSEVLAKLGELNALVHTSKGTK